MFLLSNYLQSKQFNIESGCCINFASQKYATIQQGAYLSLSSNKSIFLRRPHHHVQDAFGCCPTFCSLHYSYCPLLHSPFQIFYFIPFLLSLSFDVFPLTSFTFKVIFIIRNLAPISSVQVCRVVYYSYIYYPIFSIFPLPYFWPFLFCLIKFYHQEPERDCNNGGIYLTLILLLPAAKFNISYRLNLNMSLKSCLYSRHHFNYLI